MMMMGDGFLFASLLLGLLSNNKLERSQSRSPVYCGIFGLQQQRCSPSPGRSAGAKNPMLIQPICSLEGMHIFLYLGSIGGEDPCMLFDLRIYFRVSTRAPKFQNLHFRAKTCAPRKRANMNSRAYQRMVLMGQQT